MKSKVLFYLLLVILSSPNLFGQQANSQDYLKSFSSQLYFEENLGQYESGILYQSYMYNRQIRFLESGPSFAEVRELDRDPSPNNPSQRKFENYAWLGEREAEHEALVWNIHFANTDPNMQVSATKPYPGRVNYFRSADQSKWVRNAQRFAEIWYTNMYSHIDLRYYGTSQHSIKYDFVLRPGAEISDIELQFEGILGFEIDEAGQLIVHNTWGESVDAAPYSYQTGIEGEIPVDIRYKKLSDDKLGFEIIGNYDPEKTLVLDPLTMNWATYYHSSTSDDYVMAVDMDDDENVYIAGYTKSLTFPITPGTYENVYGGGIDCYVAKLGAGGLSPIYSTYIGGANWEMAYGLRINANREVFMAGFGASSDFPVTGGAFQPANEGGGVEGFITRLSTDGDNLIYASYLGGSDRDYIYDLEVNANSEAYVTGYTYSSDFPTTVGAFGTSYNGNGDSFVTRISADGTAAVFSTLYGGLNYDISNSISLGINEEVYIAGNTASRNLPLTTSNIQDSLRYQLGLTEEDAFVAKFSADGTNLEYATYLGGTDSDGAYGMDVSVSGDVYITGTTYSENFPTTAAAFQNNSSPNLGSGDVFVAKLDLDNNHLDYATLVAGSDIDFVKSLVVNSVGEAHILGASRSDDWPISANSAGHSNQYDIFVSVLNADGSALLNSELYGGSYNDYPRASGSMRLHNDNLVIGGTTHSPDIPLVGSTFQTSKTNGLADSPWISSISVSTPLPVEVNAFEVVWDAQSQVARMEWLSYEGSADEGGMYYIERREPGADWKEIGSQALTQTTELVNMYRHTDEDLLGFQGQHVLYRIKFLGENGAVSYSLSKGLRIPAANFTQISLYPNPVQDALMLKINLENPDTEIGLAIYDMLGRLVLTDQLEAALGQKTVSKELDLYGLIKGIYHVQIWDNHGQQIVKTIYKE